MITKWYPNREDNQFGVFIQKHARAISRSCKISVLYVHATKNQSKKFEIEISKENGFTEIIVYYKKSTSTLGKIINLFRYISSINKGVKFLSENNPHPQVIHSYILTRPAFISWHVSMRKKIPFIISEQWSGYVTGKYLKSSIFIKSLNRFLIKKSAALICVSAFLEKKMIECGLHNKNNYVIANVIEDHPIIPVLEKKDCVEILIVADLIDEIKNISGVIGMIGKLESDVAFKIRIIGAGADEMKLKKSAESFGLLNKKIFFEGLKYNKEVYEYLKRCDFLVMNSNYETFSLICAEAMSCGKPVIATRCGGPNEFVNAVTGILIEPGNESELKSAFINMLSNFQKFDSVKIKNYSDNLFSMEKIGKEFEKVYRRVIDQT